MSHQVHRSSGLDQPLYGAGPGAAVARFWRKYAVFSGRASRSEFWWWTLANAVVTFGLKLLTWVATPTLDQAFGSRLPSKVLEITDAWGWSVLTLVPSLALAIRRLHDANRTGWWLLLTVPPSILALVALVQLELGYGFGSVFFGVTAVIALCAGLILLVMYLMGPDPEGERFDKRRAGGSAAY